MKLAKDYVALGGGTSWPEGKRIAVMLTFNFDLEYLRKTRAESKGRKAGFSDISRGQYGREEGLPRILEMLKAQNVPATFFVPGIVAEKYPDDVKKIAEAGHELACHGYEHEMDRSMTTEQCHEIMEKSEALLEGICGKKPVGYRGPGGVIPKTMPAVLEQRGYLYDSSLMDRDWAYLWDPDDFEGVSQDAKIVEFPSDVMLDDFTYFFFTYSDPAVRSMYTNREVINAWRDEFDALIAEGDKILVLKLHPHMIGRGSRVNALGELVAYMKARGAWFASCAEVAAYVKNQEVE